MDIEKIKQRILDLAIRGKLVPQDPNDEPASVLIEKIKAEKEKMIKEGKIKSSKDDSYIYKASDNCYYENFGDKWVYIPLEMITTIIMGQSPKGSDISSEKRNDSLEFHQGKISFTNWQIGESGKFATNFNKVAPENSLLVCVRAPVGDVNFTNRKIAIGRGLCAIKPSTSFLDTKYLYYMLLDLKKYFLKKGKGSTFDAITIDVLKHCIIPLPSIKYQRQIVAALDDIFSLLNYINSNQEEISNLVATIKAKILDYFFGDNSSYKSYYENEFELGKIIEYEQPTDYIVKNPEYDDKYATPVLTAGKSFLLGYTNETEGVYHIKSGEKVIIFDDFTTSSHLVDFDFKVKSSAMKILRSTDNELFNIEYLYYFLKTLKIDTDNHKRYWISKYAPMKVKVHTYEEQCKIIQTIKKIQYTLLNIE